MGFVQQAEKEVRRRAAALRSLVDSQAWKYFLRKFAFEMSARKKNEIMNISDVFDYLDTNLHKFLPRQSSTLQKKNAAGGARVLHKGG